MNDEFNIEDTSGFVISSDAFTYTSSYQVIISDLTSNNLKYDKITEQNITNKEPEYKELKDVYKLYLSKFKLEDNEKNFISFIEDIFYIINENRAVKYQIDKIDYVGFGYFYILCSNPIVSFDAKSLYYFTKAGTLPILKQRLEELNIETNDRMD